MSHRMRIVVLLAIAALLVRDTVAQKPPAPAPPPSTPPSLPATPSPPSLQPSQPREDFVMFLGGRVATHDGAPVPNDVLVERVCNNRARQGVYASPHGDFSMQLGSKANSFPEVSADPTSPYGVASKDSVMGISRRELTNCELRVSASGFRSRVISLLDLDTFGSRIDVGIIVMQRGTKIEGMTLSATPYKAPKDARRAYEKGLQAERNGKLADARKYFETAVETYPSFANAWFQLGTVLQKENQTDAARTAYTQATTTNSTFLPPYLSLASMAYEAENWTEVLKFTSHILDLDPSNHAADVTGYTLDLDPSNYAEAYFYNAVANYKLNKIEAAEKSGLRAEHVDLRTRYPELHLLLAEIFARKNNYALAITEIQTYLALAPHAKDADQVREQLAKLERLNNSVSTSEKPDQR
jgi:tetratricopeptide (TPR) repeat protein